MRIKINLQETSTAGSVYSTPSMESAEQQEPSDEELAARDKDEKAREEVQAEKDRKAAAKKAEEASKKVPQTPKEKGEENADDSGDDSSDDDDDSGGDDASDDGDDVDDMDGEDSGDGDDGDSEDSGDEEDDVEDEEEDDEEATASSGLPYPSATIHESDKPILPQEKTVDTDPALDEELNSDDTSATNLKNTPEDPNAKDGDSKIEATIEAVASAYSLRQTLPYPDAWN